MWMKLHEASTIITGYTFRGAIKPDTSGDLFVFQAKDLVQGSPFEDAETLTKISRDTLGYSGRLQKNDVLLVARGMKSGAFRSTTFIANESNVIPSSSVHVIRVTSKEVLPEYLSHYLNSTEGQESLTHIISGSYIGALPRKELEKIDIPIPPLRKQEALINLFINIREQQKIIDREKEIKQNIINATFKSLTTK
jgi:restriction endonuclease S subunit